MLHVDLRRREQEVMSIRDVQHRVVTCLLVAERDTKCRLGLGVCVCVAVRVLFV